MTPACWLFSLCRVCQLQVIPVDYQSTTTEIGDAKRECFHVGSVVCYTRWSQMIMNMLPWCGNNYRFLMKTI